MNCFGMNLSTQFALAIYAKSYSYRCTSYIIYICRVEWFHHLVFSYTMIFKFSGLILTVLLKSCSVDALGQVYSWMFFWSIAIDYRHMCICICICVCCVCVCVCVCVCELCTLSQTISTCSWYKNLHYTKQISLDRSIFIVQQFKSKITINESYFTQLDYAMPKSLYNMRSSCHQNEIRKNNNKLI